MPPVTPQEHELRNIRCPSYSECLDKAVARNLSGWDCDGCHHSDDEDLIDPLEIEGLAWLLLAVFDEELYKLAREMDNRNRLRG